MDDPQAVVGGQGGEGAVVGQVAAVVHGDDGPGAGADELGSPGGIEAQGGVVDVAQHGFGAHGPDGLHVGQVGEGGDDDLVPWTDPGDDHPEVEGGVAGAHGHGPS